MALVNNAKTFLKSMGKTVLVFALYGRHLKYLVTVYSNFKILRWILYQNSHLNTLALNFSLLSVFLATLAQLFLHALSALGKQLDVPIVVERVEGQKPRSCCQGSHLIAESSVISRH